MKSQNSPPEPSQSNQPTDSVLAELEGYTELGMNRDALRLAGRILRQPTTTAASFDAALNTLFSMKNSLQRWRKRVEAGYARLSAKEQRDVRFTMLMYYHSVRDYSAASQFIPKRFRNPGDLLALNFAWDIWAELGDEESLKRHSKIMIAGAAGADDPFVRGLLLSTLGEYCLRKGQWRRAAECYREIPAVSVNSQPAVLGPLMALAGELLAGCSEASKALSLFQRHHDPDLGSGTTSELLAEHRKTARAVAALDSGLRRLLGKKRLKELGLADPR